MKNNTLFITFFITILITFLNSSCTNNPNTIKVIPKDAGLVTVINAASLIDKGGLFNLKNSAVINKYRTKQNLNKPEIKLADKVLQNPLVTGLDLGNDLFSFLISGEEKELLSCISAGLVDEELFTTFMNDFLETSKIESKIQNNESFTSVLIDRKTICAWNKKQLLIINSSNYSSDSNNLTAKCKELLALDKVDQLVQNKSFQLFYNNRKDISFWSSTNRFIEQDEMKDFENEYSLNLADNYLSFFLSFDDGQITLTAKADLNKEMSELYSKYKALGDNFNTELLTNLTKDNLGLVCLSLNTDALYESIKDQNYVSMADKMSKVTPKEFLESVGGSFALSVSSLKMKNDNNKLRPIAAFTFDLKEKKIIDRLMSMVPTTMFVDHAGYYEFGNVGYINENIYLVSNNDACLISNDEELVLSFKNNETLINRIDKNNFSNEIGNNGLFIKIPLNLDKFPEEARKELNSQLSNSDEAIALAINELVESIDFKLSNKKTAGLCLKIKNKDKNSLKVLIETIENNVEQLEVNALNY